MSKVHETTRVHGVKMVRKADLENQIGALDTRSILYCTCCGAENSANSGDYWNLPESYLFRCCGKPMVRVVKRTVYEEV